MLLRCITSRNWRRSYSSSLSQIVTERDSKFNHKIRVIDQENKYRSLQFISTQPDAPIHTQGKILLNEPFSFRNDYIDTMLTLSLSMLEECKEDLNNPLRVLSIGLGSGLLPQFFMKYFHALMPNWNLNLNVVEIDPEVISIAKQYFHLKECQDEFSKQHSNSSFSIINQDIFEFCKNNSTNLFDIIYLDIYNEEGLSPLVLEKKLIQLLQQQCMHKQSILFCNIFSNIKSFNSFVSMLQTFFPHVQVFSCREDTSNSIVVAHALPKNLFEEELLLPHAITLSSRAKELPIGFYFPELLYYSIH